MFHDNHEEMIVPKFPEDGVRITDGVLETVQYAEYYADELFDEKDTIKKTMVFATLIAGYLNKFYDYDYKTGIRMGAVMCTQRGGEEVVEKMAKEDKVKRVSSILLLLNGIEEAVAHNSDYLKKLARQVEKIQKAIDEIQEEDDTPKPDMPKEVKDLLDSMRDMFGGEDDKKRGN